MLHLLVVGLVGIALGAQSESVNTLGQYIPYQQLRQCAQYALGGYGTASQVVVIIGCPQPYYNYCYCRGRVDLSSLITPFFSSYVYTVCNSNAADVSAVFSVYDNYCSGVGITGGAPAANTAGVVTTTLGNSSPTQTVVVITTVISTSGTALSTREFKSILGVSIHVWLAVSVGFMILLAHIG